MSAHCPNCSDYGQPHDGDCPGLPEPSRWIPVSERLPETSGAVLTYRKDVQEVAWLCTGNRWSDIDGYEIHPTHWMPLPAPPEVKS